MQLTAEEFTVLHDALVDAFIDYNDLALMMARAGDKLAFISAQQALPIVAMNVIQDAAARDRVDALVAAARAAKPTNRALATVAASIGLEPSGAQVSEDRREEALAEVTDRLERLVDSDRGIGDFGSYALRLQEFLRQVCAVELGSEAGTGFLIGPETVMTNFHVVKKAIEGDFDPSQIVLRFDYQRLRDGRNTNAGVEVRLADDWLVDSEPYSPADLQKYDPDRLPANNELDYAVLRTSDKVGLQPPSGPVSDDRGWLSPLVTPYGFPVDTFLMIVQHPCNDPISFDSPDQGVIRVNRNGTRVHYRTNTMPGSSGSPIMNRKLELVGLHHSGEPGGPDGFKPCHQQTTPAEYNEGIPIVKIVDHINAKGNSWVFGEEAA